MTLGKVGIPDSILFKRGTVREERTIMQQHPEKGYRIASSSPDLAHIARLVLCHHERWDGQGYPLGLKGDNIPLECRILALVDAYDAMISNRPYRWLCPSSKPWLKYSAAPVLSSIPSWQKNSFR